MKNGWDRLRGRAEGLLGLDRLTETFRTFALLHFGFLIFNNLQTVFINTLFFRLTGGADTTLQYNLITYVFNPIGTTLAMYYASKKGSTVYFFVRLFPVRDGCSGLVYAGHRLSGILGWRVLLDGLLYQSSAVYDG